jgi:peptidyl-prolyl cis-trans isomerase D
MLEFIRQNRRILQLVLLILIIPSFVIVGAWDLVAPSQAGPALAEVDGRKIERPEFDSFHQRQLERVASQFGGQVPLSALDSPASRASSLDRLVAEAMLRALAREHRLAISDEALKQVISQVPEFQKDGVFSLEQANQVLKANGLTAQGFEQNLRSDMSAELLPRAVSDTAITPRSVARWVSQSETERRAFRIKRFSAAEFSAQVQASEEALKAHYDASVARYQSPETIDVSWVVLEGASPEKAEQFSNLVYEQSESLEPAAKQFGLTVLQAKGLQKGQPVKGAEGSVLNHPRVQAALFQAEAIQDKRNTAAVEVSSGRLVSARVTAHRPAAPLSFDQVRTQVKDDLIRQKSAELAAAAAQAFKPESAQLERVQLRRADPASTAAALRLPQDAVGQLAIEKLMSPSLVIGQPSVVSLGQAGSLVAVLESAQVEGADAPLVKQRLGGAYNLLQQTETELAFRLWMRAQESTLKVKRYKDKLEAAAS